MSAAQELATVLRVADYLDAHGWQPPERDIMAAVINLEPDISLRLMAFARLKFCLGVEGALTDWEADRSSTSEVVSAIRAGAAA